MDSQEKVELTPEAESLRAYRAALMVAFPDGANTAAKPLRPGTFERMDRTFKALPTKHRRRLDLFRCTIDRLVYIDRAMQREGPNTSPASHPFTSENQERRMKESNYGH